MSWSASCCGTKAELGNGGVDTAPTSPAVLDQPMAKQHAAARVVALQLIEQVPGPKLSISMAGHANGVGELAKPGSANDYITVSVTQVA